MQEEASIDLKGNLTGMAMDNGIVGAWSYPYYLGLETEKIMGFGAGGGIEYNWQALSSKLPPPWWNMERGIDIVNFTKANYTFPDFSRDWGVHYRF